ncbi:germinal center-associated signaling and motility protein-like [Dromiciops gliroides]|uniref:germinal center-associated signaling and motility protein-like n=1 Tax=Dromiciops gliroides TaxID=33562 RepID=UPI001CC55684|nr:germinal center-associated signaling and motility protein-like [Dromiciops gliroides]
MGNCLQRRFRWPKLTRDKNRKARISEQKKFRQIVSILKRRKREPYKESEEVSSVYHEENHEDNAKEPFYACIEHTSQRRPSMNFIEDSYENIVPKWKRPEAQKNETEYAILRVAPSPKSSSNLQDEEYELIMPTIQNCCPSHLDLMNSGNSPRNRK